MPPDRNLRLPLRFVFEAVEGRAGAICWRWQMLDSGGNVMLAAREDFDTLTDCIEDAKAHGYVEPEQRR
jgi:hypothetical protein